MKRWGKVFPGRGINLDQDLTKQRWQVPETKRSSCGESREFKGESRMMLSRGVRSLRAWHTELILKAMAVVGRIMVPQRAIF